jgi:hypothetical protein
MKCHQLSHDLKSVATKLSYEDVQLTATHIAECTANVFNVCISSFYELTAYRCMHKGVRL